MPSPYYDVRIGPLHLIALDTEDYSSPQRDWARATVTDSAAPWKIVFGHQPRFTSGQHLAQNAWLGSLGLHALQDAATCAGADLYLSGHDHTLEYLEPGETAPCPGVGYVISGVGSTPRLAANQHAAGQKYYQSRSAGFVVLEVTQSSLELSFLDDQGKLLFQSERHK
jgi:3',5'-cyclic AMP phosphodiesterase CpdA